MIEQKVWGEVNHIFADPHAAISLLTAKPGTCCSIHYHKFRINQFTVISGRVIVEVFEESHECDPKRIKDVYGLTPENPTVVVDALRWHRFVVAEPSQLVEVYWSNPSGFVSHGDIVRFNEGSAFDLKRWKPVP